MEVLTESVLSDSLDKLAAQGTPEQIRIYLRQRGIRGRRWSLHACPVAIYLNKELGSSSSFRVQVGRVRVCLPRENIQVDTPPEVKLFIDQFDAMAYPELWVMY